MPVELVAKPHPLRADTYTCQLDPGTTLQALVGDQPLTVHAQVNGAPWPRERWGDPLPDGLVTLYSVPQNDNVARVIAMVGVSIAAAYTGGLAVGALGVTGNAAIAVQAGVAAVVSVVGSLAVNALIPPKVPDAPTNPGSSTIRNSITGTQNSANVYGVVPRAYGNPRWFPPLAAKPITEVDSDEQYLRMLLCLGYGPLEIGGKVAEPGIVLTRESDIEPGNIRIGETAIEEFDDVEWEIGYPEDITLFSENIEEEALGISLPMQYDGQDDTKAFEVVFVPGPGLFDYEFYFRDDASAVRTTAAGTKELLVDLVAPRGLYHLQRTDGAKGLAIVRFRIEYRETGTVEWALADEFDIRGGSSADATLRRTYRYTVPESQYDVRVTRVHTMLRNATMQAITDFTWTALRSVRASVPYKGDHVVMALRIRATDQLNSTVDQLSLRTKAVLRVPDGAGGFDHLPTANPAWAYLDALTGPQVNRPVGDERINWESLQDWADWCDAQGLRYHHVHDASETLFDRARAIAAGGQASFSLQDGLFGVVRDDPQAPTVQMISPRNARGFESSRQFKALPHALRVKYVDPDTWTDAERIVYRAGFDQSNATEFEDFQTQGVASAEEAWHHGNYYFRQAQLRPETYQVEMDWENLACVRGNRVRLAYDTILVGLGAGRITDMVTNGSGEATRLILDEDVPAGADSIRIRREDGEQQVVGFSQDGDALVLAEPLDSVNIGDLVLMGEAGRESIDCKITRVDPGPDFTAALTLVDAAPDIYDFSSAPDFDPGITIPPQTVGAPADLLITSGLEEYTVQPDGAIRSRARVSWAAVSGASSYELLYRRTETDAWTPINTGLTTVYIDPVFNGEQLEVQVRARDSFGRESAWSAGEHTVVAAVEFGEVVRLPVPNVSGLELFEQANDQVFGGRDAKFVWRKTTVTQWRDLGWELNGAGDGALDPYFADYQVEIWAEVGGLLQLVHTDRVNDPRYTYTGEQNAEDYAREVGQSGAWRELECRVYCRGRQNQISERPARLAVSNPPPALPDAITITPSLRSVAVEFKAPEDLDYRHTRVWLSATSGFTPDDDTLAAQVDGSVALQGLTDGTTYYIRIASYDAFGQGEMSPEFSVTTQTIGTGDVEGLQDEIGDLQDAIGDKGDILFQATEPGAAYQNENTLWVDTSLDANDNPKNTPKRWDGSAWVAVSDQEIKDAAAEAYQAAQDAQDLAEGKSRVLVQSTTPAAEYENDKTLWIDTTNGANTPKHWDGTEWVSIQDGDIAQAKTDISDIKVKKTIRMDANGNIAGVENIDGTEAGQFNILSDNFNIVDPGDPGGTPLVPFTVTGGTVYANNLMITHTNLEDGSVDLAGPAITGRLAGDNIQDGAVVNITEYTESPNVQVFDGTDHDTWKTVADLEVQVLGDGSALALSFHFSLDLDQVTEAATQAGPGGPVVEMRLVRTDGSSDLIVWTPDPVMASGSGRIPLQFGAKIDTGMSAGTHTYRVEVKWRKGVYDAGTVDYSVYWNDDGEASISPLIINEPTANYAGLTFNGAYPSTYLGEGWELTFVGTGAAPLLMTGGPAVLPPGVSVPRLPGFYSSHVYNAGTGYAGRAPSLDRSPEPAGWGYLTGQPYTAANHKHKVVGSLTYYEIRCLEYRG